MASVRVTEMWSELLHDTLGEKGFSFPEEMTLEEVKGEVRWALDEIKGVAKQYGKNMTVRELRDVWLKELEEESESLKANKKKSNAKMKPKG